MTLFDPSKHQKAPGGGGGDSSDLPAGEYLLAMKWFERRTSKAGGPYLRAKYVVCYGPRSGAEFFSNVSIDVSKPGAAGRLGVYCAAVGIDKPFDLADDGALRRAFLGKPFKAKVSVRSSNGYTNHDIERYSPTVSPAERRVMDNWVLDQQESEAMGDAKAQSDDDDIPF